MLLQSAMPLDEALRHCCRNQGGSLGEHRKGPYSLSALGMIALQAPRREGVESDFDGEGRDGFVHGAMDYSMWLSFSTFWGALATHSPTSVLGRLLSMAYALFILVVINSYTANLASYLVVTGSLEYPIESLDVRRPEILLPALLTMSCRLP